MSRSSAINAPFAMNEVKKYLKPNMKVAIIGFSFFGNLTSKEYFDIYGPNNEYQDKLKNNFSDYGIKELNWVYYYGQSLEESLKIINESDILYFPGGAPDLMFARIKERGLLDILKNFKGIVIGSSAGAMIQLETFHISKDNEYFKFSLNEGLGYIQNFFIEVHYRRKRVQKSSLRKMRRKFKKPIYTIPDNGMIIVNNKNVITLGEAKLFSNRKGIIK